MHNLIACPICDLHVTSIDNLYWHIELGHSCGLCFNKFHAGLCSTAPMISMLCCNSHFLDIATFMIHLERDHLSFLAEPMEVDPPTPFYERPGYGDSEFGELYDLLDETMDWVVPTYPCMYMLPEPDFIPDNPCNQDVVFQNGNGLPTQTLAEYTNEAGAIEQHPFTTPTEQTTIPTGQFTTTTHAEQLTTTTTPLQHALEYTNGFNHAYPNYVDGTPNDNQIPGSSDDYTRAYNEIKRHLCTHCNITFSTIPELQQHVFTKHREEAEASWEHPNLEDPMELKLTRTALNDTYIVYEIDLSNVTCKDIAGLFLSIRDKLFKRLRMRLQRYKVFKLQFDLQLQVFRMEGDDVKQSFPYFESFQFIVENDFYLKHAFYKTLDDFNVRLENFLEQGSGWILDRLNAFRVLISRMAPISGGDYFRLPYALLNKTHSLINVPGNDGHCFKRAILAHDQICGGLVTTQNKKRTLQSLRFYENHWNTDRVDFTGIRFPFTIPQVQWFERQNPHIALNILCFDLDREGIDWDSRVIENGEEEDVVEESESRTIDEHKRRKEIYDLIRDNTYPISICRENREITIDLLLVVNGTESHFCLITNLVGFLKNPSRSHVTGICRRCLNSFSNKTYSKHMELCSNQELQSVKLPEARSFKFNKWSNMLVAPFILFADFESLLKPLQHPTKIHKHKASGYCWAFINEENKLDQLATHIISNESENLLERLMAQLIALTDKLIKQMHEWEDEAYRLADVSLAGIPIPTVYTECGFCHKMAKPGEIVRHHSHAPPFNFVHYAHNSCNLNCKMKKEVVCFIHNLRGYDSHFLIKALRLKNIVTDIEVIAQSAEKFPYIKINKKLVFKDSLSFFSSSLDSVVKTLSQDDFILSRQYFTEQLSKQFVGQNVDSKVELLLQKGVYPYSYFDCVEKYDETKLPPPANFFNDLTETPIEPNDYAHAQKVWKELGIKDLREYTKWYVEADVLLLADCFQRMRKMFQEKFELDPIHYLSLPQLTWDCAMKFSGVELDYIRDESMHIWLEEAKRGGMSSVGDIRAATANNKYMPDFNPSLPSRFICYHDLNNLYPFSMINYLPQKEFAWVEDSDFDELLGRGQEFIESLPENGEIGYFFEVDLHFPPETHDKFNALPPASYRRSVDYTELSPYQQHFADALNISENSLSNERLITDLHDRKKYKCHYRVLQLYLSLGVRLEYIHSAIKFKQSPFFREYLLTLAGMRRVAKSKVEQNWLKLLSNSLFGKSCENKRNRATCKLINSKEMALKYNKKPNVSRVILLEKDSSDDVDIAIVCLKQTTAYLDRPLYIGVTTLDESKKVFYDYYYNVALKIWGTNNRKVQLLYTDTDAAITVVETEDAYADMFRNKTNHFDMSEYDSTHPVWKQFHCDENKKVLGMMKDEAANKVITHFCVAKSKMYTYRYWEDKVDKDTGVRTFVQKDVKKGKGIQRSALDKHVTFEQYQIALDEPIQFLTTSTSIQSRHHDIYTIQQTKKGLSGFDVKRYIIPDCVDTLAFGHYTFKKHSVETNNLDQVISSVAEFSDTEY